MNTIQASGVIKRKPNKDGLLDADFEPPCSFQIRKKFDLRRTQMSPVRASTAGTEQSKFLCNSKVRVNTSIPRCHDYNRDVEPGTINLAMRHKILSVRPRFGAIPWRHRERQHEFKIAIIVTLFVLLVYPRTILIIYSFSAETNVNSAIHAKLWMRILLYSNSMVNPFLCSLRHREIWREFVKWFAPCRL